jgi:hypothetical protein
MITSVSCVGGCCFKYHKQYARGVEVLPFIDSYRSVYTRCCGDQASSAQYNQVHKSEVGPQSNMASNLNSTGYGTYQNL